MRSVRERDSYTQKNNKLKILGIIGNLVYVPLSFGLCVGEVSKLENHFYFQHYDPAYGMLG